MNALVKVAQNFLRAVLPAQPFLDLQGQAFEVEKQIRGQGYVFGFDIPELGARVYQRDTPLKLEGEAPVGQFWIYSRQIGATPKDGTVAISMCIKVPGGLASMGKIGSWTFERYLSEPGSILTLKNDRLISEQPPI